MMRCALLVVACVLTLVSPGQAQERLRIVTTTTDLKSLAEAVGGDRVEVTSLVPANFDPELQVLDQGHRLSGVLRRAHRYCL